MRRREFLGGVGTAIACTLGASAQQIAVRRVGFLGANTPATANHLADAFVRRLQELGWIEGKNLAMEYRWAAGQTAKFGELTQELVDARVDVIVTSGNAPAIAAARITKKTPIVLASSADVLSTGLVKSLSHPGGNVTGLTFAPEDTVGRSSPALLAPRRRPQYLLPSQRQTKSSQASAFWSSRTVLRVKRRSPRLTTFSI